MCLESMVTKLANGDECLLELLEDVALSCVGRYSWKIEFRGVCCLDDSTVGHADSDAVVVARADWDNTIEQWWRDEVRQPDGIS
jgi:hypothetical protein